MSKKDKMLVTAFDSGDAYGLYDGSGSGNGYGSSTGICGFPETGVDIGDRVVILLQGGTTVTGLLVAFTRQFVRVVTNGGGELAGTLLTIRCADISAIGRRANGNGNEITGGFVID